MDHLQRVDEERLRRDMQELIADTFETRTNLAHDVKKKVRRTRLAQSGLSVIAACAVAAGGLATWQSLIFEESEASLVVASPTSALAAPCVDYGLGKRNTTAGRLTPDASRSISEVVICTMTIESKEGTPWVYVQESKPIGEIDALVNYLLLPDRDEPDRLCSAIGRPAVSIWVKTQAGEWIRPTPPRGSCGSLALDKTIEDTPMRVLTKEAIRPLPASRN